MFRRTRLNPLQSLEAAESARARKALTSSLRLLALIVVGISAVAVWASVEKVGTDTSGSATAHAVDQPAMAQDAEPPQLRPVAFEQRPDAEPKVEAKPEPIKIDRSPEMQARRKLLLQRLSSEGIFVRAELPGGWPWVWVGPAFDALDFETKQRAVNVVYSYYLDGSDPIATVRIFDGRTNKEIGDYNPAPANGPALRLF